MTPEARRPDTPAFLLTWRRPAAGHGDWDDDEAVLYWFAEKPSGDDATGALRAWESHLSLGRSVRCRPISPPGTPAEISAWTSAANAYIDEVVAATYDLWSAKERLRRRSWWPARLWAMPRYRDAKAAALDRVDAATSAYQPVREAIDRQLADQTAADAEAARRAHQQEARRRRAAEARFQAWQRRQAVADRPMPGGLTPREMAARGDSPADWPPEVAATVGDIDTWWAGVRASVRNEQARAEAVRAVTEAVTAAATALEKAHRPGISAVIEAPRRILHGWWVDFRWSRPGVARLRTPPDMPADHLWGGTWHYDLYLPDRLLFYVPGLDRATDPEKMTVRPDAYSFASVTTERIGGSDYTRPAWWTRNIAEFAESLFPSRISYRGYFPSPGFDTPITEHADPAVFVPYVHAVAHRAVATIQALAPGAR